MRFYEIRCKMGQHDKNSAHPHTSLRHAGLFDITGTHIANTLSYVDCATVANRSTPATAALPG